MKTLLRGKDSDVARAKSATRKSSTFEENLMNTTKGNFHAKKFTEPSFVDLIYTDLYENPFHKLKTQETPRIQKPSLNHISRDLGRNGKVVGVNGEREVMLQPFVSKIDIPTHRKRHTPTQLIAELNVTTRMRKTHDETQRFHPTSRFTELQKTPLMKYTTGNKYEDEKGWIFQPYRFKKPVTATINPESKALNETGMSTRYHTINYQSPTRYEYGNDEDVVEREADVTMTLSAVENSPTKLLMSTVSNVLDHTTMTFDMRALGQQPTEKERTVQRPVSSERREADTPGFPRQRLLDSLEFERLEETDEDIHGSLEVMKEGVTPSLNRISKFLREFQPEAHEGYNKNEEKIINEMMDNELVMDISTIYNLILQDRDIKTRFNKINLQNHTNKTLSGIEKIIERFMKKGLVKEALGLDMIAKTSVLSYENVLQRYLSYRDDVIKESRRDMAPELKGFEAEKAELRKKLQEIEEQAAREQDELNEKLRRAQQEQVRLEKLVEEREEKLNVLLEFHEQRNPSKSGRQSPFRLKV